MGVGFHDYRLLSWLNFAFWLNFCCVRFFHKAFKCGSCLLVLLKKERRKENEG